MNPTTLRIGGRVPCSFWYCNSTVRFLLTLDVPTVRVPLYIEDCMRAVHSFWHCKSTVRLRLTLNILQLYVSHFMNPTTLRIGGRVPCTSSSTFTFTPNSAVQSLFLPLPAHSHEYILLGCKIFPFCTLADVTFQQFNNNQNCAFSAECTSHFTYWTAECTIADFPAVFLDALASLKPH